MRRFELDGRNWQTALDFLAALRLAIGAPEWHGWGPDAFIDSMIYGGINGVEAPYEIIVIGSEKASQEVRDYIALMASVLEEAGAEKLAGENFPLALRIPAHR